MLLELSGYWRRNPSVIIRIGCFPDQRCYLRKGLEPFCWANFCRVT